jgi:hypothetical protein
VRRGGKVSFIYACMETVKRLCLRQILCASPPGMRHFLFDYSPDMEYLEIVGAAKFSSIEAHGLCEVRLPGHWE